MSFSIGPTKRWWLNVNFSFICRYIDLLKKFKTQPTWKLSLELILLRKSMYLKMKEKLTLSHHLFAGLIENDMHLIDTV